MIQALLKGKLSKKQENMEDILTSLVIGTMKYFTPEEILMPFLSRAESKSGRRRPFKNMGVDGAEYEFWPKMNEPGCTNCEPDVLITLTRKDGGRVLVFIEAKYHSGKSSFKNESDSPNDQLAKEWGNLERLADRLNADAFLIYLTADFGFPAEEIDEAQKELKEKGKGRGEICWLSWRHFPLLREVRNIEIMKDIADILRDRFHLTYYEGLKINKTRVPVSWTFRKKMDWGFSFRKSNWHFVE